LWLESVLVFYSNLAGEQYLFPGHNYNDNMDNESVLNLETDEIFDEDESTLILNILGYFYF